MNTECIISLAAALCERFEGFYRSPYICPAGVPTIGFGATFYENGKRVVLNDVPISRERGRELLHWHLESVFLPQVLVLCPGIDTEDRAAAVLSWTFNLGAGNLRVSTMRKRINEGRWADAKLEMVKWDKAGGRKFRGLTIRRAAEAAKM